MKSVIWCSMVLLFTACLAGCGGEKIPGLAEVEGTVSIGGAPLPNVRVTFLPDPEQGNAGRTSFGVTDDQGHYTAYYNGNEEKPGVSTGWTRVILTDITEINTSRDDNPQPRRFAAKYLEARTTPLKFEITAGDIQTIDLKLDQ